jgi:hypothetical protein
MTAHDEQSELPTVDELLKDPSTSFWLRNALSTALSRDPVDAANDSEILARVLDSRCHSILKQEI